MSVVEQLVPRRERTALVLVDFQDGLFQAMDPDRKTEVLQGTRLLLHTARELTLPVLVTEQYPRGLGATNAELTSLLPPGTEILEKLIFSSARADGFEAQLEATGASTAILCGMETHVCVLGTALDLIDRGLRVHVPRDAVISRTESDWRTGLNLMERAGAYISSVETLMFQLLGAAGTPEFKALAKLLK